MQVAGIFGPSAKVEKVNQRSLGGFPPELDCMTAARMRNGLRHTAAANPASDQEGSGHLVRSCRSRINAATNWPDEQTMPERGLRDSPRTGGLFGRSFENGEGADAASLGEDQILGCLVGGFGKTCAELL